MNANRATFGTAVSISLALLASGTTCAAVGHSFTFWSALLLGMFVGIIVFSVGAFITWRWAGTKIPVAKIEGLFAVQLPEKAKATLDERISALQNRGVNFAIYASNLLTMLELTAEGLRDLAIASFPVAVTAAQAIAALKRNKDYALAVVEDFLEMLGDRRLDVCPQLGIVCLGARFEADITDLDLGIVAPYVQLRGAMGPNVGLAPEKAPFKPGIGFLLVKIKK